jgi:hypothetical protein
MTEVDGPGGGAAFFTDWRSALLRTCLGDVLREWITSVAAFLYYGLTVLGRKRICA